MVWPSILGINILKLLSLLKHEDENLNIYFPMTNSFPGANGNVFFYWLGIDKKLSTAITPIRKMKV